MPTNTPTTFASAAASSGVNDNNSNNNVARNSITGSEWSRSRPNGSTQTFRRPSQANSNSTGRDATHTSSAWGPSAYASSQPNAGSVAPGARSTQATETRYSKEQLLEAFKVSRDNHPFHGGIQAILTEGWQPGAASNASNGSWVRKDEAKDLVNADVCWEDRGSSQPLALQLMSDDERELFSSSVNSPLKPPPQNSNKEVAQTPTLNGRKSSFSQSTGSNPLNTSRPSTRRREPSDSQPSSNALASPTPFRSKDDSPLINPSSLLMRRRTDFKDSLGGVGFPERARVDTAPDISSPFASLKRPAASSAGIQPPSSPWSSTGPQSAGFGAFGNFTLETPGNPTTPSEKRMGFGSLRTESRFRGLMSKSSSEDINKKAERNPSLLDRLGESESEGQSSAMQRPYQRPSAVRKESNILEEFDQRVGSAALGGDDGFDGESSREPADLDEERRQNLYQSRSLGKSFDPNLEADRSQTSSTGPSRYGGLGALSGFGGIVNAAGWGMNSSLSGGAARPNSGFPGAFQDSLFNTMGDASSPGGVFGTPPSTAFTGNSRGSKMGSLFPQVMQDQMRNEQGFGEIGPVRNMGASLHASHSRDPDGSVLPVHGVLDQVFNHSESGSRTGPNTPSAFQSSEATLNSVSTSGPATSSQSAIAAPIAGPTISNPSASINAESSTGQMPAAQQRQMVMPDRMRWIYRDPQGATQGPWSGLEMHDWYKAGFFSPELLVRKHEDKDYEPLAQLIRRIGNSREPFLVPQIGIPHGPPANQSGGGALSSGTSNSAMQSGVVQPPFASNFPSFGTTLTADQQNALERRKQEEQFLMARQKEHLAHQQVLMRQYQAQGIQPHSMHSQGLHHHSSAHSLQSQPSYGSITSPAGYQGSPGPMSLQQQPPAMPGYYDRPGLAQSSYSSENIAGREAESTASIDRLGAGRGRPAAYGAMGHVLPVGMDHQQQVATMLQDRSRLQREQELAGPPGQTNEQDILERLEQYRHLRDSQDLEPNDRLVEMQAALERESSTDLREVLVDNLEQSSASDASFPTGEMEQSDDSQVPAPSDSPLPAPSAQRSRTHVAEKLNLESSPHPETPSAETPTTATIAPWAKDSHEGPKGPSLKEIQEAEARKAAQQEEIAAAARRALAEQERLAVTQQAQNAAAGLPSGATWAASSSPTATATPSAWAKKPTASTPPAITAKKTLSQIQKEEEQRKTRASAGPSTSSTSAAAGPAGKRYADLASKSVVAYPGASGGAWTTVGAGGKPKASVASSAVAALQRSVNNNNGPTTAPTASGKVVAPTRTTISTNTKQTAADELHRWAKLSLSKGMNAGIDVDEFVRHLMTFPTDAEIVADSVYGNSKTLDGRRFADEFVRRRKLAEKGQTAPEGTSSFQTTGSSANNGSNGNDGKSGGGWSEVAKKGGEKANVREEATAFKVVAARKKGKR